MEELRVGHEISWFDDSGSRYNAEGNLVDCGQQRIQNNFQR
jgi:predicted metalloendopeptidase